VQEFSNIYHYKWTGLNPTATLADSLIDALVTKEKAIHSSAVTFLRASCWSAGGTKAENQMITQKNLSGVGSALAEPTLDRERAWLVQWSAGLDTLGRPVRLKKWFHTCGSFGSQGSVNSGLFANTSSITPQARSDIANSADFFKNVTISGLGGVANLCGPKGRDTDGNAVAHKYLEHHQLGDMWR